MIMEKKKRREERGERREKCLSGVGLSRIEDGGLRIENTGIKDGDNKSPSSLLHPQSPKSPSPKVISPSSILRPPSSKLFSLLSPLSSLLFLLLLVSCSDDGFEYNDYHCNLTIDNSVHLDPTLAGAMNSMSPGVFCKISYKIIGGAKHYVFESGNSSTEKKFNAIDEKLHNEQRMGMYNGIIVGFGNLDYPAVFYAYDGQCPNCFNPDVIPLKDCPLSVSSSGIATCNTCKRQYNLNTGGNVISGDKGTPSKPYRASTTGPNGILHVY